VIDLWLLVGVAFLGQRPNYAHSGALATECRKLLGLTSGLGVNEPTSFFATNIVCTLGHVFTYRDSMPSRRHGVPISYSKCVVSLRKDYAQEGNKKDIHL
jgi:hypothetical protein